ncbi:MAG: GWxTD domain-containing protein, partial [Thermoanaerobaculia bacterium]|nr:GWxTD domain-containing protein [Thermoanaerobaculia bacterium]
FVDLFWARRDPTPSTPANEWKAAFEERVAVADEQWDEGRVRGSLTDRGRALILLGAPARRSLQEVTPRSDFDPDQGIEIWHYEGESIPRFLDDEFELEFVDQQGRGDFELVTSGPRRPGDIFDRALQFYLFQPDLEEVPSVEPGPPAVTTIEVEEVSTEFESSALEAAYEAFRNADDPQSDDLYVTYGEFITPEGTYFVPVQLYVPASAGLDLSGELMYFGVVETPAGEIVAVYEHPVTLETSNGDAYYDRSLVVEPGSYIGTFGLVREEEPVAVASADLELQGVSAEEPNVSDLILSDNVYPLTEAQSPTDPFAFGGLKVVPKGNRTFTTEDEIWYFFEVRNPGLDDSGEPTVRVKLDVVGEKQDGEPVKMGAPMTEAKAQPVRDTPGHYMIGQSFPAGAFPPGSYTLKAKVFDANARETWNLEADFTVVE